MAKILSMPAGGAAARPLYEEGTWNVPYDNPGGYYYSGVTVIGATLEASDIKLTSEGARAIAIGTTNKIDFTSKSILRVNAKSTHNDAIRAWLLNSKNFNATPVASLSIPGSASYQDTLLDVSGVTGDYYLLIWAPTNSGPVSYVKSISLE